LLIGARNRSNVPEGVEPEATMVKRRGDKTTEPPGGRAAERLRMFEQARKPDPEKAFTSKAQPKEKTRAKKS